MVKLKTLSFLITTILLVQTLHSQNFNLSNNSSITISGTSSLHDWDVEVESFSGNILFNDFENMDISDIKINVISESLKSGKKGMDKNTYKALKTKDHKNILFQFSKVESISKIDDSSYRINGQGQLSITGVTKDVNIDFLLSKNDLENGEGTCSITGSCTINMTDFGIEPPKALLGTIKTGEVIKVKFNTSFFKE